MEPNVTLLVNPAARRAGAVRQRITDRLTRAGLAVTTATGRNPADSLDLARKAVADRTDALIALGGDGLAHLAVRAVATTPVPLGIIPAGTCDDLAWALGLPADPDAALDSLIAALRAGTTRPVDAVRVDDRWFATVLSAGFDSAVNELADRLPFPRGPRRYDVAVALRLPRLHPTRFTLTLDGEDHEVDATFIALGNTPRYAGRLLICPDARDDDGLIDVTVVGPLTRVGLVRAKPTLITGTHVDLPVVTTYRARTVGLAAPRTTAYADGERFAPLPLTATCEPGAVRVLA